MWAAPNSIYLSLICCFAIANTDPNIYKRFVHQSSRVPHLRICAHVRLRAEQCSAKKVILFFIYNFEQRMMSRKINKRYSLTPYKGNAKLHFFGLVRHF